MSDSIRCRTRKMHHIHYIYILSRPLKQAYCNPNMQYINKDLLYAYFMPRIVA